MFFIGLVLLYLFAGLAKIANYLNCGPQSLRQFKIEKNAFY